MLLSMTLLKKRAAAKKAEKPKPLGSRVYMHHRKILVALGRKWKIKGGAALCRMIEEAGVREGVYTPKGEKDK